MANGISKNPLLDINKVYLNQIAEGSLKSLEKASVLAMSNKPEDQDKAREIKTRFDYQSMLKQNKAKKGKVTEARSDWRHDLREIITTKKDTEEPEIKEKKVKNKIEINPEFKEAVEQLGGKLLTVEEVDEDAKKAEQMRKKEKMMKKRMLMIKLRAVNQDAGGDVTAEYEPEGDMVEARYERGASDYGKMSIRNKRAVGYGGNAAPPEERRKAHQVRMKKHMTNKGKSAIDPKKNPMAEAKVDQEKDDAAKKNTRNQRTFGNRRDTKKSDQKYHDTEARRYNTEKDRGVKMRGKKDKRPTDYAARDLGTPYATPGRVRREEVIPEATRYAKETGKSFKSGKPVTKGGTAKDDKAFQFVAKKYAGQMMGGQQQKKVRGQKPDESNTPFKRAAARVKQMKVDNKALADKAKKAGYKSTQDYVNVQAVRKGGLGT